MRISHQLFQNRFQIPENWSSIPTYKLFEKIGLITFSRAGFPTFLPIGQRLVNSVNNIIREEATRAGFEEVYLPLVQNRTLLENTERADQFSKEFFYTLNNKLILAPTNEEAYIDLASRAAISYRHLPIRLFQIADKFRNIKKPKGIFRSKEFLMCDMVSIDVDEQMLHESAIVFEKIVEAVFRKLEICAVRVDKHRGRYVEYLVECSEGDIGISRNPDHYDRAGKHSSSVAMYFIFDHGGPNFKGPNDNNMTSYLGTYGFGIQRCIHAVIEQHRDNLGIAFPESIRPFNSAVIVLDADRTQQKELAEKCYSTLLMVGAKPLFDDRVGKTLKEKASLADFYGIPFKFIIGDREVNSQTVTIKWRNGKKEEICLAPEAFLKILNTRQHVLFM